MAVRTQALKWFHENYGDSSMPIYTSKFYQSEESWTKTKVWWLEIPLNILDIASNTHVILICEIDASKEDYYYLNVPLSFLKKNLNRLYKRENKISLYLSAEEDDIFIERRGEGIDFISFVENVLDEEAGIELTVKQYEDALIRLSEKQISALAALYSFPDATATTKQLATALNYNGFQAANRQIGSIGKAISESTGVMPPLYDSGHKMQPGYFLFIGKYETNIGWVMWTNLKLAIEHLNLGEVEINKKNSDHEIYEDASYREGALSRYLANRFVRNRAARLACIQHYGTSCAVCEFNFSKVYGDFAMGFIHVHHVRSISERGEEYALDPVRDLIPLCPNCHAAIHLSNIKMTIGELREMVLRNK